MEGAVEKPRRAAQYGKLIVALTLLGRHNPLASAAEQLKILAGTSHYPPFDRRLGETGLFPLHATGITVFQIKFGKL